MDSLTYLLNAGSEEILQTWASCGSIVNNKNTKIYPKESIFRVDAESVKSPLHNAIIYVNQTYSNIKTKNNLFRAMLKKLNIFRKRNNFVNLF
jgi:hypothetical protein